MKMRIISVKEKVVEIVTKCRVSNVKFNILQNFSFKQKVDLQLLCSDEANYGTLWTEISKLTKLVTLAVRRLEFQAVMVLHVIT